VAPAVDKQGGSKYGNNNRCRCGTLLSHHHAEHPSAASHLGYTLPVTTAEAERLFSKVERTATAARAHAT